MSSPEIPLSDPRAARRPLLFGSAAAAALRSVEDARRWQQEAELIDKTAKSFMRLPAHVSRTLSLIPHIGLEADNSPRRELLLRRLLRQVPICVTQEGVDAALESGSELVIVYGDRQQELSFAPRTALEAIFFGDATIDADFTAAEASSSSLHFCERVSALIRGAETMPDGPDAALLHVHLSDQSSARARGNVHLSGCDQTVIRPRGPEIRINLDAGARCELGEARGIFLAVGATVVLNDDARCTYIEAEAFPSRSGDAKPLIVDEHGEVLFEGMPEDGQGSSVDVRGIRVEHVFPF